MEPLRISYVFKFADKPSENCALEFDPATMRQLPRPEAEPPAWTRLETHQCEGCPLNATDSPYCPVARNLSGIAEGFKDHRSYEKATVFVQTAERGYLKKTDLQTGLQSLFGLIMATSGCPRMDFLRLMARFHLPFATFEETMVRTISLYLLRQYFLAKRHDFPDFTLDGLKEKYEQISQVNRGIISRIRSLGGVDANQNAVVFLDAFASLLPTQMADFSTIESLVRGADPV